MYLNFLLIIFISNNSVKAAVLDTLSLLLEKVGVILRPFVPQMQQTFLRSLVDPHKQVRLRAAKGLSHLVQVHIRCDSVFQEVHTAIRNADDPAIRETALYALRLIIIPSGDKMSDVNRKSITMTISALLSSQEEYRVQAAAALGSLVKWLPEDELSAVVKDCLLSEETSDWLSRHGSCVALRIALDLAPEKIVRQEWLEKIHKILTGLITSDRVLHVLSGLKAAAHLFKYQMERDAELNQGVMSLFCRVSFKFINVSRYNDVIFFAEHESQ